MEAPGNGLTTQTLAGRLPVTTSLPGPDCRARAGVRGGEAWVRAGSPGAGAGSLACSMVSWHPLAFSAQIHASPAPHFHPWNVEGTSPTVFMNEETGHVTPTWHKPGPLDLLPVACEKSPQGSTLSTLECQRRPRKPGTASRTRALLWEAPRTSVSRAPE